MAGENRQAAHRRPQPGRPDADAGARRRRVHLAEILPICEYLEEIHPTPPLIGTNAEERAVTRMWTRRIDLNVCEPMANGFRYAEGLRLFENRMRCIPQAADDLKAMAAEKLTWLDGLIAGRQFIVGDRFTLADILLFVFVEFGAQVGQPLDPANKNLAAWRTAGRASGRARPPAPEGGARRSQLRRALPCILIGGERPSRRLSGGRCSKSRAVRNTGALTSEGALLKSRRPRRADSSGEASTGPCAPPSNPKPLPDHASHARPEESFRLHPTTARSRQMLGRVAQINALEPQFAAMSRRGPLRAKTDEFRARLADGATLDDLLNEAFAVVREASKRTLGQRHYDVQLVGGMVLHHGGIAEMRTGEGKTLVATLPVYLNALAGKGVHVVTVNDYLANRDAEWMGQIYRFLGLTRRRDRPRPDPGRAPARLPQRHHLRHQQRVRLRLPARQPGLRRRRDGPARRTTSPSSTRSTRS